VGAFCAVEDSSQPMFFCFISFAVILIQTPLNLVQKVICYEDLAATAWDSQKTKHVRLNWLAPLTPTHSLMVCKT
jgi:hypothetical protein